MKDVCVCVCVRARVFVCVCVVVFVCVFGRASGCQHVWGHSACKKPCLERTGGLFGHSNMHTKRSVAGTCGAHAHSAGTAAFGGGQKLF